MIKSTGEIDPPPGLFDEFCARFPYEETDDQLNSIADVLADLASGRPMDRLICGDVGFGKTEVALRAAFVVAMSGKQVAMVCPTTLLARQHYKTFSERFRGWPVKIGRLSRLVPAAEANATREALDEGRDGDRHRHPRGAVQTGRSSRTSASSSSTRSSTSGSSTRRR